MIDTQTTYRYEIEQQLLKNKDQLETLTDVGSQLKPGFRTSLDSDYPETDPDARIFYFDVDNTLYRRSTGIQEMMQDAIYHYVRNELSIPPSTAKHIMGTYYKQYGLMVAGLVRNFGIDPSKYNLMVDDSLDIGHVLKPNLQLRKVLLELKKAQRIDKLWLCTNAYVNHAVRCIKLLGIADLFDGVTFTRYDTSAENGEIVCKPDRRFFDRLKLESGLGDWQNAYFIDDSFANVHAGASLGMAKVFLVNERVSAKGELLQGVESIDDPSEEEQMQGLSRNVVTVNSVCDLPAAIPSLFK
mgnify:FL=1